MLAKNMAAENNKICMVLGDGLDNLILSGLLQRLLQVLDSILRHTKIVNPRNIAVHSMHNALEKLRYSIYPQKDLEDEYINHL